MVVCNEEARLRDALLDARTFADELVVVVQQSDDNTLEIARELADIVIEHPRYGYCEASRPAAYAASTGEWCIGLDADERLTEYGKRRVRGVTVYPDGQQPNFYRLRRLTAVNGDVIEDYAHGRLFRRGYASISTKVHTEYEPAGSCYMDVINDQVVIEHFKTTEEQQLDDRRCIEGGFYVGPNK